MAGRRERGDPRHDDRRILRDAAARAPDRTAIVAGTLEPSTRIRRTYAEAVAEAEAVARTLAARSRPVTGLPYWRRAPRSCTCCRSPQRWRPRWYP